MADALLFVKSLLNLSNYFILGKRLLHCIETHFLRGQETVCERDRGVEEKKKESGGE